MGHSPGFSPFFSLLVYLYPKSPYQGINLSQHSGQKLAFLWETKTPKTFIENMVTSRGLLKRKTSRGLKVLNLKCPDRGLRDSVKGEKNRGNGAPGFLKGLITTNPNQSLNFWEGAAVERLPVCPGSRGREPGGNRCVKPPAPQRQPR